VLSPFLGGTSVCGGSIITVRWVLTAAHCVSNRQQFTLRFGSLYLRNGGQSQTSFRATHHPQFNEATLNNDIGVVSIPSALTFSNAVQAVRLPTAAEGAQTFNGILAIVSGWGAISNLIGVQDYLRWVDMRVIPNAECSQVFGPTHVVSHVLCGVGYTSPSNQGHCGGDSGGPLVTYIGNETVQIGVVSFGAENGCGYSFPSGYMRTGHFIEWINSQTGSASITYTNFSIYLFISLNVLYILSSHNKV